MDETGLVLELLNYLFLPGRLFNTPRPGEKEAHEHRPSETQWLKTDRRMWQRLTSVTEGQSEAIMQSIDFHSNDTARFFWRILRGESKTF